MVHLSVLEVTKSPPAQFTHIKIQPKPHKIDEVNVSMGSCLKKIV